MRKMLLAIVAGFASFGAGANIINANSANYTSYLGTLVAGDTLMLAAGTYTNNLTLNGRNGTVSQPIVIMGSGNTTIFQGQACCNTVSITQCSYLVISHIKLDGQGEAIDAVKAEGTAGNWAHHITLQYLDISGYDSDQQNVGISTKCHAWNWLIRKNRITGAGTGLYLGNSNGDDPFVNGVIEYNYVAGCVGYNMEIKHQLNGVRDSFPGTSVNGGTIIRHNVFTKDSASSSTGGSARPNLLVGGFPTTGWGATDKYEIYGNFFYNNPVEALFQGTGNVMLYDNIFVNRFDPSGFRAVYLTPQNGVSPQNVKVFHNTAWVANSSGGIRLYNPNTSFQQSCYGNAVFATQGISGFTDTMHNIVDAYTNAATYVLSPTQSIGTLNMYPKSGQLTGTLTPNTLFTSLTDYNKDLNGASYTWTWRGAYSGCCTNPGWQLELDTMTTITPVSVVAFYGVDGGLLVYPNPAGTTLHVSAAAAQYTLTLTSIAGQVMIHREHCSGEQSLDLSGFAKGVYLLTVVHTDGRREGTKLVVE